MKKILVLICLSSFIMAALPAFADADLDLGGDNSGGIDMLDKYNPENAWNGQKKITDEDFEKTMKRLEAKKKKRKFGQSKPLKGKSLKEEADTSDILGISSDKSVLLGLPVTLLTNEGTEIPIGHYKVVGVKIKGKVYFDFYQAYSRIARVEGVETESDFNQDTVSFIKIIPYDEHRVKIIFGSLDFNAYAFINIENTISDSN